MALRKTRKQVATPHACERRTQCQEQSNLHTSFCIQPYYKIKMLFNGKICIVFIPHQTFLHKCIYCFNNKITNPHFCILLTNNTYFHIHKTMKNKYEQALKINKYIYIYIYIYIMLIYENVTTTISASICNIHTQKSNVQGKTNVDI